MMFTLFDFTGSVVKQSGEGAAIPAFLQDPQVQQMYKESQGANPTLVVPDAPPTPVVPVAATPVEPTPPIKESAKTGEGNPTGEPIGDQKPEFDAADPENTTFTLLAMALQDAEVLPENFPLEDTKEAGAFVKNLKENIQAQIKAGIDQGVEKWKDYVEKIDFLENGGPEHIIKQIKPLDNLIKYDFTGSGEEVLAAKEDVIAMALHLKGNGEIEIENNIQAYHKSKIFDDKFETSLAEITAYRNGLVEESKELAKAGEKKLEAERAENLKTYNAVITNVLDTGILNGFRIPAEDLPMLREAVLKQDTQTIQYKEGNKIKSIKVSELLKFVDEVTTNPETQLFAFYNWKKGYNNIVQTVEKMKRAKNSDLIGQLNERIKESSHTSNPEGVPSVLRQGKLVGQV